MAGSPQACSESLLVLVGITATRRSRRSLERFFALHGPYRTLVPNLPLRRGIAASARWLQGYLAQKVHTQTDAPIHVLAYIAGGVVLRCLTSITALPPLARIVYVRGPVQELVPAAMIGRYGRLLARLVGGRSLIDLADGWATTLPMPSSLAEQGLIVEEGVSGLARSLGLGRDDVPEEDWDAQRLLPGGSAVLRLPTSHDDAYTSPVLLTAALAFFRQGRFGAPRPETTAGVEPERSPVSPEALAR